MLRLLDVLDRKIGRILPEALLAAQGVLCRHESDTSWDIGRKTLQNRVCLGIA